MKHEFQGGTMINIRKKYANDLVIHLQKSYGLYFVEFREAPNGKKEIILCNPNNKDWWIAILLERFLIANVFVVNTGDIDTKKIEQEIYDRKYIGTGKKYNGKWLRL